MADLQNMDFLAQQLARMGASPTEVPVYTRPAGTPAPQGLGQGILNPAQVTFTVPPTARGPQLPTYSGGVTPAYTTAVKQERAAGDIVKEQLGAAREEFARAAESEVAATLSDADITATIAREAARMDAAKQQILVEQQDAVGINNAIVQGNRIIAQNTQRYLANMEALSNARADTSLTSDPLRWLQLQVQGASIEGQLNNIAAQTTQVEAAVKNLGLHADNNAAILKSRLPSKTNEQEAAELSRITALTAQKAAQLSMKAQVSDANFAGNILDLYKQDTSREASLSGAVLSERWKEYQSEYDALLGAGRVAEAKIAEQRWKDLEKQQGLDTLAVQRLTMQLGVPKEAAESYLANAPAAVQQTLRKIAYNGAPTSYQEAQLIASLSDVDNLRADPATRGNAVIIDTLRAVPQRFDEALDAGKIKIGKQVITRQDFLSLGEKEKAAELDRFYRGLDIQGEVIREMGKAQLPAMAANDQQRTMALMPTVGPLISALRPTNTNTDALRLLSESTVKEDGTVDRATIREIAGDLARFYRQRVAEIKNAASSLPIKQYTGQDNKAVGDVVAVEQVEVLRPSMFPGVASTPTTLQLDMSNPAVVETALLMQAQAIVTNKRAVTMPAGASAMDVGVAALRTGNSLGNIVPSAIKNYSGAIAAGTQK